MKKIFKPIFRTIFFVITIAIFSLLAWWTVQKIAIHQQAVYFATATHEGFAAAFKQAGINYPPRQLALLVFKDTKQLEIYARDHKKWQYIKTMPIFAASGHAGPKLHEGDRQVPEGIYKITELNPFSDYTLSMELNYPNDFDKLHAQLDHRTELGEDIFIHGSDLSIGCIAIGDEGIKQLFPLVYQVGIANVIVIIAPNDLRIKKALKHAGSPKWTAELYLKIKKALAEFPVFVT